MSDPTRDRDDRLSRVHPDEDIPRLEPWLIVAFLSLVPAAVAIALPSIAVAAWIATGILLAAGIAMFVRDSRRNR